MTPRYDGRKHITDWPDLSNCRQSRDIELIRNRIKEGAEPFVKRQWEALDFNSVPALLIESTSVCKNRCSFCPKTTERLNHSFGLIPFNNLLEHLISKNLLSIWITGGEILYDIDRVVELLTIIEYFNLDVERISTSLCGPSDSIDILLKQIKLISERNKFFKLTLSIGINSYLHASHNDIESFLNMFSFVYNYSISPNICYHFPIIIDDRYAKTAHNIINTLCDNFSNISFSFKNLVPLSLDNWKGPTDTLEKINISGYMDCAIPSLFPCTWPMWQLNSTGDLFCCSTWYNDPSSLNFLGNISSSDISFEPSYFLTSAFENGGWIPYYNKLLSSLSKNFLQKKVPIFNDNTQKCLLCRLLMSMIGNDCAA